MKSIKDLREQYDLITEKEEAESRKLTALVRAGLFDAKKLPALKKTMEKGVDKMSAAEKRMLINLLDSLMSQVLSNQSVYQKVKQNVQKMDEAKVEYLSKLDPRFEKKYSEKDIPTVLVLKRKAVRVYPDFQKVALYYAQAIDKYVSIPFGEINVSGLNEARSPKKSLPNFSNTVTLPSSGQKVKLGRKVSKNKNSNVAKLRDLSYSIEKLNPVDKFFYRLGRKHRKMIMSYLKNKKSTSASSQMVSTPVAPKSVASTKSSTGTSFSRNTIGNPKPITTISEEFKIKLHLIREANHLQINEGAASDFAYGDLDDASVSSIAKDLTPGLGTARAGKRTKRDWEKGNYGSAALNAVDTALSGVSDAALVVPVLGTAASGAIKAGLGAVKGLGAGYKAYKAYRTAKAAKAAAKANKAADAAKVVDKTADAAKLAKTSRFRGKLGKAARIGAAGLGAVAGTLGAAATGAAAPKSTNQNYQFGNINKTVTTSDSFTQKNPTTDAQERRDYQAQKAANRAMSMRESTASQRLRARRRLGKNIAGGLSGTANALSSMSSTTNPTQNNYQFGNINKIVATSDSFSKKSKDYNPAQSQRDYQAQKKANQAQSQQYESVYMQLNMMVESEIPSMDILFGDNPITINNTVAKKIIGLHESVNKSNKKKMEKMLDENASSFNKVLTFALRY